MEWMPCAETYANAVFLTIGVLALPTNPGAGRASLQRAPPSSCVFSKRPTVIAVESEIIADYQGLFAPPIATASRLASACTSHILRPACQDIDHAHQYLESRYRDGV